MGKVNFNYYLISCSFYKNQFQADHKSKRELLENHTEYLHDLQVGINKTTNTVDYVKNKNICSSKKKYIIKGENSKEIN